MIRAYARFQLPPFVMGWRLALDALAFWFGVRVVLALVLAFSGTPSPLLLTPRTSAVAVAVVVVLCGMEVRRLRETVLLRNLGVSLPVQLACSFTFAATAEFIARWLVGSLGGVPT